LVVRMASQLRPQRTALVGAQVSRCLAVAVD